MDQKSYETLLALEAKKCSECPFAKEVRDQGRHWGWACKHEEITKQRGFYYGRYHQIESKKPRWCPICVYLLTKCIDYPEGYCLKKAKPIYEGINKDCGRLCWGTSSSYYKEKIAGGKEGD